MSNHSNEKILSGLGWSYAERLLAQVISLVVSTILARMLTPSDYGVLAMVTVFINILDSLVTGGFGSALVQKRNADSLDFNTICWFSVICAAVLYALLFFAAPNIALFYEMEELTWVTRVMGIRIVISAFNSVQHAYVQRNMEFKRFFGATMIGTVISAIIGITMAYAGFGVWALVAQYMTNATIDTVVLYFTIAWKPKLEWSRQRMKGMLRFGLNMLGATLVNTIQDNVRSLVIGKVFTSEDLAHYNQGKKYPSTLMNNLVGSVQKVMFPAFAEQQDTDEIKRLMRRSIRVSSFVLMPAIIGMIAVADTFIVLLLTEKWAASIPYMRILSLIYLTRTMNSLFQSSLLAAGKSDINMYHEFVGSVISVILICIGAFVLKSVLFIAWSSVFVMIEGTIFFMIFVSKYYCYRVKEMIADFLPYLLTSAAMGAGIYLIGRLEINNLLLLLIQIFSGVIIYICLSWLLGLKELKDCFRIIKKYTKMMLKKY